MHPDTHYRRYFDRISIPYSTKPEFKQEFLKSCDARPCTPEVYAKWLSAYIEDGNEVQHFYSTFRNHEWIQPTKSTTHKIPVGYGADALNILLTPESGKIPLDPSNGGDRAGWEWGHTTVCVLRPSQLGDRAWTNKPRSVSCFEDIIPLLSEKARTKIAPQLAEQPREDHGRRAYMSYYDYERGSIDSSYYDDEFFKMIETHPSKVVEDYTSWLIERFRPPALTRRLTRPRVKLTNRIYNFILLMLEMIYRLILMGAQQVRSYVTTVLTHLKHAIPKDEAYELGRSVVDEINGKCELPVLPKLPTIDPLSCRKRHFNVALLLMMESKMAMTAVIGLASLIILAIAVLIL